MLTGSLRRLAWLGFAGSALMAISSYWVGAVPLYFRTGHTPVVSLMTISSLGPRIAFYVGLAAMLMRLAADRPAHARWSAPGPDGNRCAASHCAGSFR